MRARKVKYDIFFKCIWFTSTERLKGEKTSDSFLAVIHTRTGVSDQPSALETIVLFRLAMTSTARYIFAGCNNFDSLLSNCLFVARWSYYPPQGI